MASTSTAQTDEFLELLLQLKKTTPSVAREILTAQPQIAYGLIKLLVDMGAVNVEVLQRTLATYATTPAPVPAQHAPTPQPTAQPAYRPNSNAPQAGSVGYPGQQPPVGYGQPPTGYGPSATPGYGPNAAYAQPQQAAGYGPNSYQNQRPISGAGSAGYAPPGRPASQAGAYPGYGAPPSQSQYPPSGSQPGYGAPPPSRSVPPPVQSSYGGQPGYGAPQGQPGHSAPPPAQRGGYAPPNRRQPPPQVAPVQHPMLANLPEAQQTMVLQLLAMTPEQVAAMAPVERANVMQLRAAFAPPQ